MICFERTDAITVPGCIGEVEGIGENEGSTDYCVINTFNMLNNRKNNLGTNSYAECEGDCDSDKDCIGSLQCQQRVAYEEVPGCFGEGGEGADYCFDPNS